VGMKKSTTNADEANMPSSPGKSPKK
jgi:hypothetical protein